MFGIQRKSLVAPLFLLPAIVGLLAIAAGGKTPAGGYRYGKGLWPSTPPKECPFPLSKELTGVESTGRSATYTDADTWYPAWAADGNLYSPWTDGIVNGVRCYSVPGPWKTGNAKIVGDDPMKLTVTPIGVVRGEATPYGGRYPCASLVHKGVWYYGTYCIDKVKHPWDTLGPFVGFRTSRDGGRTWRETPCTPEKPLFGESGKNGAKIKMGSPHAVDFGQEMRYSPDGKMYLVGHGATRPGATCSWISGDQIYLARVTPTVENVNDAGAYEFFAGHDAAGRPVWAREFAKIRPLLEWNDHLGCATITYNAPLKKYLLCTTNGGVTGQGEFDSMILEADAVTGPWRLVSYLERFGRQGYFLNFPSKFISADGRTMWLSFSGNWEHKLANDPPGSRYAMCLYEVTLQKAVARASRP